MQKKSLLVALFCGALCLTGCLKNEESPSVARVRNEKANELNSIAELNKAKAQAEVIYANAEATLKNAQAELEKANAALVLAQAETEKVNAQLLAVQVKLAEVQVEEEKVNLQMMQADLESRLAFLEAEKAAAEAAKQAWVNVLNDLLAQAEINAIENAKGILDAEQQLEDYILTLEGQKADSAKYYSQLYFAALKDVEEAQVQELEAKAQRVLVNQGAILAREYIHEEIDAANDTIAMNQAFIDALKEKQTMSPEEAQVALIEARKAAGEAYAAYLEALKAEGEARTAANEAFDKTADFTQGWDQFTGKVMSAMPHWARVYNRVEEVTVGEGETERTKEVPTTGIRTWSEENGVEFVPFWNGEVIDTLDVRYPYTDVVPSNQKYLKDIRIVPATINYDNIQAALDNAVEREEAQAERNIARRERRINRQIAALEKDIAKWEDTITLHKAYLAARKDSVAKYEKAYKDAVATAEGNNEAVNSAWEAFQLYMLTEHPTVSRELFIARNYADTQYQHALIAAAQAKNTYESNLKDTVKLKADVKKAFEAYAKAKGNVVRIADSMLNPSTTAGEIYAGKLAGAIIEWNPDFADAAELKDPVKSYHGTAQDEPFAGIKIYNWTVTPEGGSTIAAGHSQDTTLSCEYAVKVAKAEEYAAKIDYWAGAKTEAQWKEAQKKLEHAQAAVTAANEREATAWQTYANYYGEMIEALGNNVDIETAFDAFHQNANDPEGKAHAVVPGYPTWNNDVFDFVSFPTDAIVDPTNVDYKVRGGWLDEGEWTDEAAEKIAKAGTAQKDLINAVKAVRDARVNNANVKATYDAAMSDFATIKANYEKANKELIEAIKGAPMTKDDKIEGYLDKKAEGLYQAYLAALDKTSDVFKALMNLWTKGYASYPDEVGKLFLQELVYGSGSPAPLPIDAPLIPYVEEFAPANPADPRVSPEDDVIRRKRNFGWLISSYMVDPEATYVGFDGEDHSIAELFFHRRTRRNNPYRNSLQWKVDDANNTIEVELPEELAKYTAEQNKNVEKFKADVADIMNVVNSYKSFETGYQDWVAEREAAYEAYNETKIATWAAHDAKKAAEDEYEAINAVANEGIYIYDPKHELDGIEASRRSGVDSDYIKISIAKQIEILEEDNERLEGKVEFLRNVLKDGKKVLSVVNEILDQKIEVLSEEVAIKAAIALKYKALMNAYLGIDDEEEAEGETSPLDGEGEGDDEE